MWGAPPPGDGNRFSLNRSQPGGGSLKLGIEGDNGVMVYDWPISVLSVDWARENFGTGRFQATWILKGADGRFVPRGHSRKVDIVGGYPRARQRPKGSNGPSPFHPTMFYRDAPAPAPAAEMPAEVVDMRVRAAEEIATARIKAQQEIFREQLEWQRRQAADQQERLEERLNDRLEQLERRYRDDGDDEPRSELTWLKDLVMPFAPALQSALPELLKRFAGAGKVLPPG